MKKPKHTVKTAKRVCFFMYALECISKVTRRPLREYMNNSPFIQLAL